VKQYLIADSGGTKTDWCLIDSKGEKSFFTTESTHPSNWNDTFFKRIKHFLQEIPKIELTDLYFFGSGCLNEEKRIFITNKFKQLSFNKVSVKSDIHAAGYALFGSGTGWGAIMGTGSVVFKWNGKDVEEIIGGKGHLEGDEGSGFYFGNLIYEDYLNNRLSTDQKNIFLNYLDKNSERVKFQLLKNRAVIAKDVYAYKESFHGYHEKNLELFYLKHLENNSISSLRIVGGYGFHHSSILSLFFDQKKIAVNLIIDKPIANLVEQMGSFID